MQCITRESLQNEKFSLSVLLNKIYIHSTVLLQITTKPSITVLTNSFFITLPLDRKASSFISKICRLSTHWYSVPLIRTHTAFWRTQPRPSGQALSACFTQDTAAQGCLTTHRSHPGAGGWRFPKAAWCSATPPPARIWDPQGWRRNIFWPSSPQAQPPSSPPSLLSHLQLRLAQVLKSHVRRLMH